jgi:molybdenum cofactor biosynthesis enzyme
MVSISDKESTKRTATAICSVHFSNPTAVQLIRENRSKKGDVLGVARIAGIMAAKRTADLIPLCHPITITHVSVQLDTSDIIENDTSSSSQRDSIPWAHTGQGDSYEQSGSASVKVENGVVNISATVSCDGKTGVEMEALTAASTTALTVYDMCKAVDKGIRIEGLRVIRKEGGKSGIWIEGVSESQSP